MSKNISIQEGTTAKVFTGVSKIVTKLAGEDGTQNWIPEDEAIDYISLGDASITENGTYTASGAGYNGFGRVDVNVQPELTTKSVTENGTYRASDDGADGYSSISVDVESEPDLTTKTITENGTYNASEDDADGYSSVTVNVSGGGGGTLITKQITQNGTYNASDDSANGYSSVTVNVSYPHGHIVVPGITRAPVAQRISTSNFLEDFDEQLFLYLQNYYSGETSLLLHMEEYVREGKWWKGRNDLKDLANYDNLVLVAFGARGADRKSVGIMLWIMGIMDESAEITLTNFVTGGSNNSFDAYLYNDNKYIKTPYHNGVLQISHATNQGSEDVYAWTEPNVGARALINSGSRGDTNYMRTIEGIASALVYSDNDAICLTNLTGGTRVSTG